MPDDVAPPVFTLSYVPTVDDVAEMVSTGVRKSRRAASTGILAALVLIAIVLVALMARMGQEDDSGPAPIDELIGFWVIGWSCALLWVNARRLTTLAPFRLARLQRARDSVVRTPYEVELSEEGLTSRTDELAMRVSWSYFAEVEETRRQFILKRPGGAAGFGLPKHALPSATQVDALRAFLEAHIARPS